MMRRRTRGKGELAVLLAEEDEALRASMARALKHWGADVYEAATEEQAIELLSAAPGMIVTEVRLRNGGSGTRLATAAAAQRPSPVVVVISGRATPLEAFRLAQVGATAFITKPFEEDAFLATIELALDQAPQIEHQIALQVGRVPYFEVLDRVRRVMLEQALAQSGGNRIRAAEELQVTRQAVQQMIRKQSDKLSGEAAADWRALHASKKPPDTSGQLKPPTASAC